MFGHPARAVGKVAAEAANQLPKVSELSQLKVLTILMGHPVHERLGEESRPLNGMRALFPRNKSKFTALKPSNFLHVNNVSISVQLQSVLITRFH